MLIVLANITATLHFKKHFNAGKWGKRDDNLGEIVINAKELALSGDERTFELTRNGKPEMGTITLAAYFLPTSALTKGNNIAAENTSTETLVLKVLKARSLRKGDMFGQNDVYVQAWRAPSTLALPPPSGKKLPGPDKKVSLPGGRTTYAFAFPTRADSPGSAVINCGDYAYIAYYIKVEIDRKGWKNPSLKLPITVIPSRPVPMRQLLSPAYNQIEPSPIYAAKFCCFKFKEAGTVNIKLHLNRRAFAPGETLALSGSEVMNDSTMNCTWQIVLRQDIKISTSGRLASSKNGYEKFTLLEKGVASQSHLRLDDLKAKIPAVPPSFFGANGLSVARREPLRFSYKLVLQVKAPSGHKVKVEEHILVSALPATREAIENFSTSGCPPIVTSADISTYAVSDDGPCETVALQTGLEDGGVIETAATGTANIWEQDDTGASGNTNYIYQPQVLVFPEPDTVVSPTTQETNNDVDHNTGYNELLSRMAIEYDSRLAVDKWIKEYPMVASSLTPDEFGGVLKKVTFSLEQAAVARELASGMKNGSLSVDHIVASTEACPFSKVEIIKVMAPHVSDPERKDIVLSGLYSYEKVEASKMFAIGLCDDFRTNP